MSDPNEMKPSEVAGHLGVSVATIRRWALNGTLRPSRTLPSGYRRYARADVEKLAQQMTGSDADGEPS